MRNIEIGLRESLSKVYDEYRTGRASALLEKGIRGGLQESTQAAVVPLYSVQRLVRPLFGKGDPQPPSIGNHPDFLHLEGTNNREFCPITTLFLDIENSTRLGVVFEPEEAYRRKNAIICMAIEIIKTFDGHVHRIMGDAVMAYFGGKKAIPHQSAIDALNCAAFLRYFFEKVVLPQLNGSGGDDPFGIRIGLDYGPQEQVLWASYGYAGMNEITATSFFVDVAAKLQGQAGHNRILIGQSLRDYVDFPEELLQVPTISHEGESEADPYVRPNYKKLDGRKMNYRKYRLRWEQYLRGSYVAVADAGAFFPGEQQPLPFYITAGLCREEGGTPYKAYYPCSGPVPKDTWIRFEIHAMSPFLSPERIRVSVENHGLEASAFEHKANHSTDWISISRPAPTPLKVHYETTAYRGLHDLVVDVGYSNTTVRTRRFPVYVE